MKELENYYALGELSEEVAQALKINVLGVYIKESFAQEIENGEIGKFLKENDFDYECLGVDFFMFFATSPHQVRDGGGGNLILCHHFNSYIIEGISTKEKNYALRIKLSQLENGFKFWECIGFDTNYNPKQNDVILWER